MTDKNYNFVDSETGTIVYNGLGEITKGNHRHMPSRTDAYLETDERGHIQASSLGGSNRRDNIVPQSADLNHGAYYGMERGERAALDRGCSVQSEKIAFASNQPGNRPDAFLVNDTIVYTDGQVQNVQLSFANMTNAEQEGINAESVVRAADLFSEQPAPGDGLRNSMSIEEYTELMEETDETLPNIGDMFEEYSSISSPVETDTDCNFDSYGAESSVDVSEADDGADISVDDE